MSFKSQSYVKRNEIKKPFGGQSIAPASQRVGSISVSLYFCIRRPVVDKFFFSCSSSFKIDIYGLKLFNLCH